MNEKLGGKAMKKPMIGVLPLYDTDKKVTGCFQNI